MAASKSSILAVRGIEKTTSTFRRLLVELSDRLGVDVDHLATVISFESAGTFSPSILNMAGSGAVGLIQFMPLSATLKETKEAREIRAYGATHADLAKMTAEEQLTNVEHYFKPMTGKLHTLDDVYLTVFYPAAIGKSSETIVFDKAGTIGCKRADPTVCYRQNAGFDKTNKGYITVADITAAVHEVADAAGGRRIEIGEGVLSSSPSRTTGKGLAFVLATIAGWFGYRWLKSSRK